MPKAKAPIARRFWSRLCQKGGRYTVPFGELGFRRSGSGNETLAIARDDHGEETYENGGALSSILARAAQPHYLRP